MRRLTRLLTATAVLVAVTGIAGCASSARVEPRPSAVASPHRPSPSADPQFQALEVKFDARLGVYALDTDTGRALAYRGDDRFAYASTFKALAAAMLLDETTDAELDTLVRFDGSDLLAHAPITEQRVASGMTLRELADAAVRYSDNTAGNLVLERIGGPSGLAVWLKRMGDDVTHVDRREPALNEAVPGDIRDTSTPKALASDLQSLILGDALGADDREVLTTWMADNTTGDSLIRAGVPTGWKVADKSGAGGYGTRNDIAVVWPTSGSPIVLAIMSSRAAQQAGYDDALIAQATLVAIEALRR